MFGLRHQTWLGGSLRRIAAVSFVGYCMWNAFWLSKGHLPPSIWSYFTGLPCPSSGVSRSLGALLSWDFSNFLCYNPFSVPFLALTIVSLICMMRNWRTHRRLRIPTFVGRLWLVVLVGAWVAKFIMGNEYW